MYTIVQMHVQSMSKLSGAICDPWQCSPQPVFSYIHIIWHSSDKNTSGKHFSFCFWTFCLRSNLEAITWYICFAHIQQNLAPQVLNCNHVITLLNLQNMNNVCNTYFANVKHPVLITAKNSILPCHVCLSVTHYYSQDFLSPAITYGRESIFSLCYICIFIYELPQAKTCL